MTLAALALDPATEAPLTRHGFDPQIFAALRARRGLLSQRAA